MEGPDINRQRTEHINYIKEMPETGIDAEITVSTVHNQGNLGLEEFQEVAYNFSDDLTDEIDSFCEDEAPFGEHDVYPLRGRYEGDSSMVALIPLNDEKSEFPGYEAKIQGEEIVAELDTYLSEN